MEWSRSNSMFWSLNCVVNVYNCYKSWSGQGLILCFDLLIVWYSYSLVYGSKETTIQSSIPTQSSNNNFRPVLLLSSVNCQVVYKKLKFHIYNSEDIAAIITHN